MDNKIFLDIHIETHQGGRSRNEDYAAKLDTALGTLALICDGMGGAKRGDLASELATRVILDEFTKYIGDEDPRSALLGAIQKANLVLFDRSRSDPELRGMGTTVAAMLIHSASGQVFTAHVGDSRVYHIRDTRTEFRTRDHSVVQEMVDRGEIKEKNAHKHPDSNRITRALGIRETVEVEINGPMKYRTGDIFLITSDGVHGMMDDKEMFKITRLNTSVDMAQYLVGHANENGTKERQGLHDNMTVVVTSVCAPGMNRSRRNWPASWVAGGITALLVLILVYVLADGIIYFLSPKKYSISDGIREKAESICSKINDINEPTLSRSEKNSYLKKINEYCALDTAKTATECRCTPKESEGKSQNALDSIVIKALNEIEKKLPGRASNEVVKRMEELCKKVKAKVKWDSDFNPIRTNITSLKPYFKQEELENFKVVPLYKRGKTSEDIDSEINVIIDILDKTFNKVSNKK